MFFYQIIIDDCGFGKGCFRFLEFCIDDCNFFVMYNVMGGDKVEFELSGKGIWVVVGFSNDCEMVILLDKREWLG